MPRWASRIQLEIVDVRAERIQEILGSGVEAEGYDPYCCSGYENGVPSCGCRGELYIAEFAESWDSLNAKRGYGWGTNPWVWVVEFRPLETKT